MIPMEMGEKNMVPGRFGLFPEHGNAHFPYARTASKNQDLGGVAFQLDGDAGGVPPHGTE
jgi:hypothetical protein